MCGVFTLSRFEVDGARLSSFTELLKQLGSVLLDDGSPQLRDVPVVDWMDSTLVFKNAEEFADEKFDKNLDSRLALMESSVQRIVAAERIFCDGL